MNNFTKRAAIVALACVYASGLNAAENNALVMEPKTVEIIIETLKGDSQIDRMEAAISLGEARIGTPKAIDALKQMLNEKYPPARASALFALGRCGEKKISSSIIQLLKDEAPEVRIAACQALAELGDQASASALPFSDKLESVRIAAFQSAGRLGNAAVGATVGSRFDKEENANLRAEVIRCLDSIADKSAGQTVLKALKDADPEVVIAALAWTSNHGGNNSALYSATAPLLAHKHHLIRRSAARAALKTDSSKAEPEVMKLCADKVPTVAKEAALSLADLGSEASLPALRQLQNNANRDCRRAASLAIVKIKERNPALKEKVEAIAVELISGSSVDGQVEGAWMLGEMKSSAGFEKMLSLALPADKAKDKDVRLSSVIIWAISRTGDIRGAKLAMAYSPLSGTPLSSHANRALGKMKHQPATGLLVKQINETVSQMGMVSFTYNGPERENAIWALGEIATKEALDGIARILTKKQPEESEENANLIGEILTKNNYDNKNIINDIRQIAYKEKGGMYSSMLADIVGKLTGERPDVPKVTSKQMEDTFFINSED